MEKERNIEKIKEEADTKAQENTIQDENNVKEEENNTTIVYAEKKKSKKKIIIFLIIIILLIGLFLWWWFNRKFDVTFQYNNGLEDKVVKVKYLHKIKNEDIKKDLSLSNYSFVGYYETYYLSGKDIEKIKKNSDLKNSVCKKDFKLDNNKTKCISVKEFDFVNTKIKSEKTIEVLWSTISFNINPTEKQIYVGESFDISFTLSGTNDTRVTWLSEDNEIASVNESGHVIGTKVGKTNIIAESNGIRRTCAVNVIEKEKPKEEVKEQPKVEPKDEGTVSLSTNNQCIIGTDTVSVNATVSNALNDTITWSNLKCYNINKESNNKISISRIGRGTMCRDVEELNPIITATLNNGNSDSLKFNYEQGLVIKVYDGDTEIQPSSNGSYYAGNARVVSNIDAVFSLNRPESYIKEKTNNSITLHNSSSGTVTVKTACGQTKTIDILAIIN